MNSKPHTLDPKMKEIYDRVMGTVVVPPTPKTTPATPIASTQSPNPATSPVSTTPATTPPPQPTTQPPSTNRPVLVTEPTPQPTLGPEIPIQQGLYGTLKSTPVPNPPNPKSTSTSYTAETPSTDVKKKSSPLIPIMLTISGIIFFIIYAIFWIKFFNLPVSFLPI